MPAATPPPSPSPSAPTPAAPERPTAGDAASTGPAWVIATRESRLALWQAEHVRDLLQQRFGRTVSLLGMTTRGDQILDRSLSKVGGKGLFVKELEVALEEGRADLAVHSLKDVPMELPPGYALACVLEREDPRDAFVSVRHARFADLPAGAVVGTSSLRRVVQLQALRPDLRIEPLRGNLDTRLGKLDAGQYDAIVLAAAGLKRLGLESRIRERFDTGLMLPAAGQGALGIEVQAARGTLRDTLATLNHLPTWLATLAERAVSRHLGGSCSMPLAAHGDWPDGPPAAHLTTARSQTASAPGSRLRLRARLGDPQGVLVAAHAEGEALVTDAAGAEALGREVAERLRQAGGAAILATLPGA